ncbi:hypothetical protein D8Y24_11785 [Agrococcus lahaulensis]|nr:hypothetical protein D8Y24_11785 [Agrococcus lahaulensis]
MTTPMPPTDASGDASGTARPSPARAWAARHRRALGLTGAVVAAAMAVLWTLVVPEQAAAATGVQQLALRWGHAATWALLAVVGALVALDAAPRLRSALAWASLACYAAFLLALWL